jgi:phage tail sheath protein FI
MDTINLKTPGVYINEVNASPNSVVPVVPVDAFQVNIGLGSTMTADDLLNGYLRVTAQVAVVHPAEFIVINIEQQATSG